MQKRVWALLSLSTVLSCFLVSCTVNTNPQAKSDQMMFKGDYDPNNYSLEQLVQKSPRGAPILPAQVKHNFIKGADLTSLLALEELDTQYYHFDGSNLDALTLLKMQGFNTIALRLYHNPLDDKHHSYGGGHSNLDKVLALAKRIKALGMNFNLQIQFSDFYTSSELQVKPKAWQNMHLDELNLALFSYGRDVIKALALQNTLPNMVQIANSLDHGFLWQEGYIDSNNGKHNNYDALASLLKHAIAGVEEGYKLSGIGQEQFKIVLNFNLHANLERILASLLERNVRCDLVSLNYNALSDGSINSLVDTINLIQRKFKQEVVVNSSYAYTLDNFDKQNNLVNAQNTAHLSYPISLKGQEHYLRDIMESISNTDNGIGFFYIEPAWISYKQDKSKAKQAAFMTKEGLKYLGLGVNEQAQNISLGSAHENQALFDNKGRLLDSVKVFNDFM